MAVISLSLFIIVEKRATSPLIDFKIMLDKTLLPSNILIMIIGLSMFMVFQSIPVLIRSPVPFGFGDTPNVLRPRKEHPVYRFFRDASKLYATASATEVLCICAAEIGYKTAISISLGYILGYGLSAFTTFATILGRSTYSEKMCSCCSVLDQGSNSFVATLLMTFKNCGIGVKKMTQLYKQLNLKTILWTSLVILVTAETACILTAEMYMTPKSSVL